MTVYNLIGQRFGKLLVIKPTERRANAKIVWECLCDCGKTHYTSTTNLTSTKARIPNCGCVGWANRINGATLSYGSDEAAAMAQHFHRYRHNAAKRDIVFDLPYAMFVSLARQECYYCGVTNNIISVKVKQRSVQLNANGIDRLDSSIGYITENCVPACSNCNLAKQSLSVSDFIALAKRIAAHHA